MVLIEAGIWCRHAWTQPDKLGRGSPGIDWEGSHHRVCVMDNAGDRVLQTRAHDVAGLTDLDRQRRQRYAGRGGASRARRALKANLLTGAEGPVAGKAHSALAFAELLGLLNRQPADYDDAIEGSLDRHPDATIFRRFPGIGLCTAATLLAEFSEDRGYYPDPRILLAEAGQAPAIPRVPKTRPRVSAHAAPHDLRPA